jgi:tRNA(adenine34) deaminase
MFKNYTNTLLLEAKKALNMNEVPVSAIAVIDGKIIAKAHNKTVKLQNKTAHAEMLLIQKLRKKLKTTHFFDMNISVYITLEPCCMCVTALAMCGIKNVFYMLEDEKFGGVNKVFVNTAYFKPNFYFVYNEEYQNLLQSFFQKQRNACTTAKNML